MSVTLVSFFLHRQFKDGQEGYKWSNDGFSGWVPGLQENIGSQDWVLRLGPKAGSQGLVPRSTNIGFQGWVQWLSPLVGSTGQV